MSEASKASKTNRQCTSELEKLRQRIAELEASETRLRQTEKELQVSGERYRSLVDDVFDSSQVGIIFTDAKFKIVWVNQSLECYFGLRRDDILGKDMRRLIRDRLKYVFEDPQVFMEKALAAFQNGTLTGRFECHVLANDEREEWWLEHWSQPISSGLYAGGVVEYYTDITERKKAEEALRQSEIRYRRLFEAARDGILILDAETGQIVDVNPFLVEVLGFSRERFIGRKIWELGFLKDVIDNKDKFVELQRKKYIRYESLPLETADGRRLEVEFVSNVYEVGYHKVVQCNIRDITERKRAEEALERAAQEWKITFDSITDMISIHDRDFRLVRVNRAFAHAFKSEPKQLIGKPCYELVHGANSHIPHCPVKKTFETQKPSTLEFFEPGLGIHFEVFSSPVFGEKGEVVSCVHVARDVTERKRMQEQLVLADRLASIGELASGIAHELNNPLTSVLGFSQLALEKDVPANTIHSAIKYCL